MYKFFIMKLIVVDDNKTFREGFKYYVENLLNHEVIGEASNGFELLKLNNKQLADVIIMDIEMPDMNGIEAAKEVLSEMNTLKLIAITSYTDKVYLRELLNAGFRACIFKDNIYNEFEDALDRVMNNRLKFPIKIKIG